VLFAARLHLVSATRVLALTIWAVYALRNPLVPVSPRCHRGPTGRGSGRSSNKCRGNRYVQPDDGRNRNTQLYLEQRHNTQFYHLAALIVKKRSLTSSCRLHLILYSLSSTLPPKLRIICQKPGMALSAHSAPKMVTPPTAAPNTAKATANWPSLRASITAPFG